MFAGKLSWGSRPPVRVSDACCYFPVRCVDKFVWFKCDHANLAEAQKNWVSTRGYAARRSTLSERAKGYPTSVYFHRIVVGAATDSAGCVDHVNGDITDCRRTNLRKCTKKNNSRHRTRAYQHSKSGVLGIVTRVTSKGSARFLAYIHTDKKTRYLGTFLTMHEAVAARTASESSIFGDYAPIRPKPTITKGNF